MIKSENKNIIRVEEPKKEGVKKEEPAVIPVKEEKKSGIDSFLVVALVIGGVIGTGYYFRVVKAKRDRVLEDFGENDEGCVNKSESESGNEESHRESLDEDNEDELLW